MTLPTVSFGFSPDVVDLVAAAGLPVVDLQAHDRVLWFRLREPEGTLLAVAGLELHGRFGLLRSLAVRADVRGQGLGRDLLRQAESEARRRGIAQVFLLTETARGWFEAQGYHRHDREEAPAAIAASSQFTGVCPASAALMSRRLGPVAGP